MYLFQQQLKNWNVYDFGNIFQDKKKLETTMTEVQQAIINEGRTKELKSSEEAIKTQLNKLLVQE